MNFTRWVSILFVFFGLLETKALAQRDSDAGRDPSSTSRDSYDVIGSTYVTLDSWIYPALDRLQALGYIDYAYRGLRPWTRSSIAHMLDQTEEFQDFTSRDEEAYEIVGE